MYKKLLALLLALAMVCSVPFQMPVMAEETSTQNSEIYVQILDVSNTTIEKYGNVNLDVKCADLLASGFEYGDVVTVSFLDKTMDIPVCSNYSDVETGETALFARSADTYVKLAINMGNFATTYGIATKTVNEDKSYFWTANDGVTTPVQVTIAMKEKAGYLGEYTIRNISYTDSREDYPDLTDEQFANFRNVSTTGMGKNTLYRGASPINPAHNRNTYSDDAMEKAGVTVVMNLADSQEDIDGYEGFTDSYYASIKYIPLNLGVDTAAEEFKTGLGEGLKFFAENPGVYMVHCTEGKDRAGFVNAILECFMGATAKEVVADYMVTFYNYYGVVEGDTRYDAIANSNIVKSLQMAFGIEDLYNADLAACAEAYIKSTGLTDEEIAALKTNLGTDRYLTVKGQVEGLSSIEKYGHMKTNIAKEDMFAAGYEYGDVVTVTVGGKEIEMPFCSNYADVDDGALVLLAREKESTLKLSINNRKIAEEYGFAAYSKDEAGNVVWTPFEGVTFPLNVSIQMKEAKGYLTEYEIHKMEYTDNREDYPALTDEQFANFRAVTTTGVKADTLYRSASPINPEIGRNTYADAAIQKAGVTVVMNLADSEEKAKTYEGYADSYYATTNAIYLNLNMDLLSADFKEGLAKGLKHFAANPGVYEVHCTEGKDRAGYVIALLECFAGASAEEVVADYMTTYYNYYGVTKESAAYDLIAQGNIVKSLQNTFEIEDLYTADLAECAYDYFYNSLGLTEKELANLLENVTGIPQSEHVTYDNVYSFGSWKRDGEIRETCKHCGQVIRVKVIPGIYSIKLSTSSYTYDGKVKKPTVKLYDKKGNVISSDNYSVSYAAGRKYVGTYKVHISCCNLYDCEKDVTFVINPPTTSIKSLKAASKAFTVTWSKKTTQVTGYQIKYSTSKSFSSSKTVTVSKNSTTSKKISSLKAKKKYYVKVRTYKTVSGKKYYSKWSSYKYVTTK